MGQSFLSKAWYYSKIAVTVYVLFLAVLFFMQRKLIYFPDKTRPVAPEGTIIANVKTQDGLDLQGWYFPPQQSKPVIVFFHGNAANIFLRQQKVNEYLDAGYGVLLAEYRGFGGNPGDISEQGFYLDALSFIKWLEDRQALAPSGIVLYGESIGGGVAVEVAASLSREGRSPFALVLEVPFTSLVDMARLYYPFVPVDFLLKDRFMNSEKIRDVRAPLLVVNGDRDEVIPFQQGQKLFEMAGEPKKYVKIPGGDHNNLHRNGLQKYVLEFLAGIPSRDLDNGDSGISKE